LKIGLPGMTTIAKDRSDHVVSLAAIGGRGCLSLAGEQPGPGHASSLTVPIIAGDHVPRNLFSGLLDFLIPGQLMLLGALMAK